MPISNGIWTKDDELKFFEDSLKLVSKEKLFYYTNTGRYLAYWPKNYNGRKSTLQSRNGRIGDYTEKWCCDVLNQIAYELNAYAVNNVICEKVGLSSDSPADIAICKTDNVLQKPEDILAIFEVKMSIVWNWEYIEDGTNMRLECVGDYRSHSGNPGLLRSDTMLKAIGKSVGIRTASIYSSNIPIVILGNTPISNSYEKKVDNLKRYGIIQGFWSLNPRPLDDDSEFLKSTRNEGFITFSSLSELKNNILGLLNDNHEFFACWKAKNELGRMIDVANRENTYELKAEKFLELLKSV
ncbi:hypothetical protein [Methanocella conradii]|uniref:hypothetical protein n=1 Tax=Methanocella conradii TaxID=1175444 RepID=UPI0024B3391D|nr:hypothetical protein [Methanocella conradii]MDI6897071.1 hypothetical protein [Methanocella conradii]